MSELLQTTNEIDIERGRGEPRKTRRRLVLVSSFEARPPRASTLHLLRRWCSNASTHSTSSRRHSLDIDKQQIIKLFNKNVKGREICLEGQNINHDGKEGHWLEKQMGIKHNAKNQPDINGYEMKKSSNKITLGDFSASEYAFSKKRSSINEINNWTDKEKIDRTNYIRTFGNPNPIKNNRYSWSGSCVPIYGSWNSNGQMLSITENNDIVAYYSFSKDTRTIKNDFHTFLQNDDIVIALWKASKMKPHIDNKFNKKGFFMCKKNKQ